jgi:hypothetical protein
MSTKIWTAYKLQRADYLWPLVHDIRIRGTRAIKRTLKKLYLEYSLHVKTEVDPYRTYLEEYLKQFPDEKASHLARLKVVQSFLRRGYRIASTRPERSVFNFDVSIGFRHYQGGLYLIPYTDCSMKSTLDFLKKDKRLRDYHYQNQTDKPPQVSARQWNEREKIWLAMDSAGQWEDVLVLDLCKWDMWYKIDPWLELASQKAKYNPT